MLENKVSLLLTSSDFSGLLWSEAFLADLHLVRTITARHSITTLPPPSVLHASIFASQTRVKQCQSSSVPRRKMKATGSCLLYAGRSLEQLLSVVSPDKTIIMPVLSEVFQPFHLLVLTTLQTQVPLVSIGHRGSSPVPFG